MREADGRGSHGLSVVDVEDGGGRSDALRLERAPGGLELACVAVGARVGASLTDADLARRRDGEAFRLALPVLESSARRLASSRGVLSFFDAEGWRLWIGGDLHAVDQFAGMRLVPGTRCDRAAAICAREDACDGADGGTDPPPWGCSAPVLMASTGERIGVVCTGDPRGWREVRGAIAARAIARGIAERLGSARLVRDHVLAFALEAARATGEGVLGLDCAGRVIAVNDAARRQLGFEALDVPDRVREAVSSALHAPACAGHEIEVGVPGRSRVALLALPIRYEEDAVGGVVRVLPRESRRSRGSVRSPSRAGAAPRYTFRNVLGESRPIRAALALAQTAARNDLPVVLNGESGTGKELFAQAIHCASGRRDGPFVAVNCGSIPAALSESELFGYEPGSFTGASRDGKAGKFEQACGGTIFLDEVSELSPTAQTALLRVLQEREVVRLGGSTPRPTDVRVLAATNRPLEGEVRAGRFRADLYFRLNVLAITIPPLRERREDVAVLAREFLAIAQAEVGRAGLAFSDDALRVLRAQAWPGNVRELLNVVLRSAATAPGNVIEARDLVLERQGGGQAPFTTPERSPLALARDTEQRRSLLTALESSSWNISRAAQMLSVSRMTLYRWLRKHDIVR